MSNTKNYIAIHFSAYVLTNFGQSVIITGNCPQLGLWNPKNGIKLQTNTRQYPIWFSKKPIILQKLINLQYKICILDSQGVIIRWENLKNNRNLSLKTNCSIFLTQGQAEVEYDFDNQDSSSTQFNSTKKNQLSDIEQEQNDDQTHQQINDQLYKLNTKRCGSSKDHSYSNQQKIDQEFLEINENKSQNDQSLIQYQDN